MICGILCDWCGRQKCRLKIPQLIVSPIPGRALGMGGEACSGVGDTRLRRLRIVSIFTHQLCVCSILRERIPNMTSRVGSIGFG